MNPGEIRRRKMKQNRERRILWISVAILLAVAIAVFAAIQVHTGIARGSHLVSNCGEDENGNYTGGTTGDQTGLVSNCGEDENGNYTGGQAGDQTGHEWDLRDWPDKPWTCVLRYPEGRIGIEFAALAKDAADNDLIGYDQQERTSFWKHLAASGYDPAEITVPCEADCSSGVAAIVKAVGYRENIPALQKTDITMSTSFMKKSLAGEGFDVLSDSKYLTSPDYLLPGDIVLYENHHVVINVTEGNKCR